MSIIVTNAKNRISYAVLRSMGNRGIKIFTSDFSKISMSFYSKYSYGHFLYPSPFSFPEKFISTLIHNIKKVNCEVLIPIYEEMFLISKYKDVLVNHVNLVVPDYESILSVHDKKKLYQIAGILGIQTPKTIPCSEARKNIDLLGQLQFPVLIKPRQGGGAWGIKKITNPETLKHIVQNKKYPENLNEDRFLIQEVIKGTVYCCALLCHKGSYRAGHCYKQLRETPISGGTATLRESVFHPQIMQEFRKLLKHLEWHGVCHADFIIDETTGIPFLIDVNPRFWSALFLSVISGVDFPYLMYKMAMDGDVEIISDYQIGVKSRWIWGDLKSFIERISQPLTNSNVSIFDFLKIDKNERFDDLDVTDPLPFCMWFVDYLHKMVEQKTFKPAPHDSLEGIWE